MHHYLWLVHQTTWQGRTLVVNRGFLNIALLELQLILLSLSYISIWHPCIPLSANTISLVIQLKRLVILNIFKAEELLHILLRAEVFNALFECFSLFLIVIDHASEFLWFLSSHLLFGVDWFTLLFHFYHLCCLEEFWRCCYNDSILRQIFQCQDSVLYSINRDCLRLEWLEQLLSHPSLWRNCLFRVPRLPECTFNSLLNRHARLTCIHLVVSGLLSRSLGLIVEVCRVVTSLLSWVHYDPLFGLFLNQF